MSKLLTLLSIFLSLFSAQSAYASHYGSADLTITYDGDSLSPLRYKIKLTIYKFCEPNSMSVGTNLRPSETVSITSSNLSLNRAKLLPAVLPTDTFDNLCPIGGVANSCSNMSSIYPGFVKLNYIDTVILPGQASDFVFSWTGGTRNSEIINLDNPGSYNMYISAGLNNLFRRNNATPEYLGEPTATFCVNQLASFLNNPSVNNNDSLITFNVQPRTTATSTNAYANAGNFSLTNPIGSTTPYSVGSLTSVVSFTPSNTGRYVVAFRTERYDRATKTLLSYTTRDALFYVMSCNNPIQTISLSAPQLTGGTLSSNGLIVAHVGVPLGFSINATSAAATSTMGLTSNHAVTAAGSSFSVTSPSNGNLTGHLGWTPAAADTGYHLVQFNAVDSACSVNQPLVYKSSVIVPILVLNNTGVGIQTQHAAAVIHTSPNPAGPYLNLQNNGEKISGLAIYDLTGRLVFTDENPGNVIDLKNIAPGHYILKASGTFGVSYARFTKL